ncbi:MAG: TlpA disulfide reductase family protein [Pseudomonadota bacterium]|nr:TlpA disulfide reductase family protein [Pseudomonadota bacterium]
MLLSVLSFPTVSEAGELRAVEVPALPELQLPDLSGQDRALSEFRGKVVLLNFWASWCGPCLEEMPSIQRLAEQIGDESFAVIAVNVGEAKRRVKTSVDRLGIDFPVFLDKDGKVSKRWAATVLPTTYILDREGMIRYVGRGPLEWDRLDITEIIQRMVADEQAANP